MRKCVYFLIRPFYQARINRIIKNKKLFCSVEIETINRCNGICPFCPINHNDDTREFARMDKKLFEKIIDELSDIQFSGAIALFSNNEPFIDSRIIDFAKYTRQKCDKAYIHIYTNGTLLTREKLENIMPYLDKMIIDNYNDKLELNEKSKMVLQYIKDYPEMDKKIEIHLRLLNEVLYTRGGQSPNNHKKKLLNMPCLRAFEQMVIRPTGEVSLCCNDCFGKITLGDCKTQSLKDIWYSEKNTKIKSKIAKGRKNVELCKYCDSFELK